MDLLQTQTPGSDLILHAIVLPHVSTMRHYNFKLNSFPLLFKKNHHLIVKTPSFRLPLHFSPNLFTITIHKFDIYEDKPNETCLQISFMARMGE